MVLGSDVTELRVTAFDRVLRVALAEGGVAFVAIHRLIAGRAFGGIRLRRYASETEALADALALARAMSRKAAMAGIAGGGAKTVIMLPLADRGAALRRVGDLIERLAGQVWCGGDLGFTAADQAVLESATRYVACGNLAAATARSVEICMRALWPPTSVAIQGVGAVGLPLARSLGDAGVRVWVHDLDPRRTGDFEAVSSQEIYGRACDVFAPCGAGGVIDHAAAHRLRCRLVCGGANNPLTGVDVADLLHGRGILYVPDFIANSGATIVGASRALGEVDAIEARMAALPGLVTHVMEQARHRDCSPHDVAVEMADARLRAAR